MRPLKQWEKWLEILNNRIWEYYIAAGFLALGIGLLIAGFNRSVTSDDKILFLFGGPLSILAGIFLTFMVGKGDFETMRTWQVCIGCGEIRKPDNGAEKAVIVEVTRCIVCNSPK